jgi:hypothetical protein
MSYSPSIEISHYEHDVPPAIEAEMDRLYGSLYSSLSYFRIYGGAENANTYVARKGDRIAAIFLFRLEGNIVRVINEGMHATPEELERFTNYAFAVFPAASAVVFHAVPVKVRNLSRPIQSAICTDDIAVTLDATVQDYLARLGNSTRKNIRRHKSKLERMHPSFQFRAHAGSDIDERFVRDIIGFNHRRMASKGKASSLDDAETQRIIRLVRERGLVTVATVDGKVAGGAIVLRIGDCFCSLVNAHDSRYDAHRLGTICCFLTICECIERGGKRFDLMWGHYDYKTALLGEHRYLYRIVVYRSKLHLAANWPLAIRTACEGWLLSVKLRSLEMANRDNKADAPLMGKLLNMVRGLKAALAARNRKAIVPRQAAMADQDGVRDEESMPT